MRRFFLRGAIAISIFFVGLLTSCSDEYTGEFQASNLVIEQESLTFDYTSSSKFISVKSIDLSWKVAINYSTSTKWITVTPSEGKNGASITVKVDENKGEESRTATLTLISADGQSKSNMLTIVQESRHVALEARHTIPSLGDDLRYSVPYAGWSVTIPKDISWIHATPLSGSDKDSLNIVVDENNELKERSGSIKLQVTGERDARVIEFRQIAASVVVTPSRFVYLNAQGTTYSLKTSSKNAVTFRSMASWIKAEYGNNTLSLTIEENLTGKDREGKVILSVENTTDEIPVVVQQLGQHADIVINDYSADDNLVVVRRDGHGFTDLGLSVYWSTCNIGSEYIEKAGDYFAWGEVSKKDTYSWDTYKLCEGNANTLTKYNNDPVFGTVDNQKNLTNADDAARVLWGKNWRIPTLSEMKELMSKCERQWCTVNGIIGMRFIGPNKRSLFLPAAGFMNGNSLIGFGADGWYWTSETADVCHFFSLSTMLNFNLNWTRCLGCNIRPVSPK